ncbi:MAG: DNA polymerase III subunit gamma/tau [Acidobacteriota bacterium]
MSYQVIARKWRPQTFEEVTGQEIITHTLRNAIEHDRLHHAYLFSGARGVGKTTTARLLAKALNCHKTDGPNLTPCAGVIEPMCPSCLEISESRSIDVLEIDAASHTGIDDVRETIIESISFNPARDRYKVFIIDEVHQLSKPAFNALLKTLEEPPPRVVFVMATTELHKVPDTILSRCQEFQFRTIPLQKIFDRLRLIADAEKIDITDDALREIARSGEGSMRDAQSNFDQVISFSGEKITPTDVGAALGFAGVDILTRVVKALGSKLPKEMLSVVDDLVARGHDLRSFCRDLLGLFRDMLVYKVAGNDEKLFDSSVISAAEMQELSAHFTEADLLRFFNSLADTETRLKEASHSRYVLEIGLVKLVELRRVEGVETLLKRLDALENGQPRQVGSSPQPPAAARAAEEKKTLITEPPRPEPPIAATPVPEIREQQEPEFAPPAEFLDEPPEEPPFEAFEPSPPRIVAAPQPKPSHIRDLSAMPVRLPPIPSEDLEHFDDTWLDAAYELKIARDGDSGPYKEPSAIVDSLLGSLAESNRQQHFAAAGMRQAAAAPARAYDTRGIVPEPEIEETDVELPVLGEDPTEEELLAYGSAHPVVKRALRIFRGRIVQVERSVR